MSNIIVVGGGISGLATLHFLKQRYQNHSDIRIQLLEKNDYPGGTIRSLEQNGCLFETGPNGFLDSKPRTLQLMEELGLKNELIQAAPDAKFRYICLKDKLYSIPTNPKEFLLSPLFNPCQKIRILKEIFVPRGSDPEESVYNFGKRRFGKKFTNTFLDAIVTGIYAGDVRGLNLKASFPRIHVLEQEYGSLFKAMLNFKKQKKNKNGRIGSPAGNLTSLKSGMGKCINALHIKYQENILLNHEVKAVSFIQNQYAIKTSKKDFLADALFLCAPAYGAVHFIKSLDESFSELLAGISYAPVVVIGLVFPRNSFVKKPQGFGYLIPSSEGKQILGVLFENNIFPQRCSKDLSLIRVMLGGARFPNILKLSQKQIVNLAIQELNIHFPIREPPQETFFIPWPKAVPQYNRSYLATQKEIQNKLRQWPNLHIVANYWQGISFNDCIENAFQTAQKFSL